MKFHLLPKVFYVPHCSGLSYRFLSYVLPVCMFLIVVSTELMMVDFGIPSEVIVAEAPHALSLC